MRTRIPAVMILLGLGAVLATPSWAQPVPATPRPAVAPAVVVPQAATPTVAASPAVLPAPAALPQAAAPFVAVAPAAPPAIIAQAPPAPAAPVAIAPTQTPPPPVPPPPAPPVPAQAPKVQAPKVIAPPEAPPFPPDSAAANLNVRVDVTISDQAGSGTPTKKTVSLTVSDFGTGSVRSGVTVPIPSTVFTGKDAATTPMTSYSYRDMGLSLDVRDVRIRGNYVRLRLAVEYNPVDEKMAGAEGTIATMIGQGQAPASFARFSQSLELALESGKPLIVASSSDPVPSRNRTASLEVKATILK